MQAHGPCCAAEGDISGRPPGACRGCCSRLLEFLCLVPAVPFFENGGRAQVRAGSSEVEVEHTFLSPTLRIARNADGQVFIYTKEASARLHRGAFVLRTGFARFLHASRTLLEYV
jgi:hypothetical protein